MERDRRDDPDSDSVDAEPTTTVSVRRSPARRTVVLTDTPKPPRLAPRPEKGLPFEEALDDTMRDHHAVFAALAK